VIFSFFDKTFNECNVVGTPGSGCRPSAIARMWLRRWRW